MSLRDTIRAATLGRAPVLKRTEFRIDENTLVFVQAPSVKKRNALLKSAGLRAGSDAESTVKGIDLPELMLQAVIALTVDDRGEQVFTLADKDALSEYPAGGWLDELAAVAMQSLNVKAGEDPEKN